LYARTSAKFAQSPFQTVQGWVMAAQTQESEQATLRFRC